MPLTSFGIGVGHGLEFVRGPVGGTSPLLDNLVSYWKLDESSGTRIDSASTYNLTDNGGVGSATGIQGNAASFVAANSEFLSAADDPVFRMGSAKTIAFWARPDAALGEFAAKMDDTPRDWSIDLLSTRELRFLLYDNSVLVGNLSGPILTLGIWYFIVAWYDGAAGTINLQVNDGTVSSLSGMPSSVTDDGATFYLGRRGLSGSALYLDGILDEVGIWNRVLTATERTQLYNSGSGITYPF